jgi:L-lysine exporter family protein LysE/ArgO
MIGAALVTGFTAQASLILVLGAQNCFVLRQGLLRSHVGAVVTFCMISDIILAALGVMGLASIAHIYPSLLHVIEIGAVIFLLLYAGFSFRRAYVGPKIINQEQAPQSSLLTTLGIMAAFTWANPHVWVDTVLLLGTVANAQPKGAEVPFLIGASVASAMWFVALGYGARILQPVFMWPTAWRVLDVITGVMMVGLAFALLL